MSNATSSTNKGTSLKANEYLQVGDYLHSSRGCLLMQADGALVILATTTDPPEAGALCRWSSGTSGQGTCHAVMQTDGNFVIYKGNPGSAGPAVFDTKTWSVRADNHLSPDCQFSAILDQDGQLKLIYSLNGQSTVYWNSGGAIARERGALWMTNEIAKDYEQRYLCQITVPGTHDSGAYKFEVVELDPDENPWIKALDAVTTGFNSTIAGWGKAHSQSIFSQLCFGVREFDLRFLHSQKTDTIRTYHGYVGATHTEIFSQIQQFLDAVSLSREIILLKISHLSTLSDGEMITLCKTINEKLGNYLPADTGTLLQTPIGQLTRRGPLVVVCFDTYKEAGDKYVKIPIEHRRRFLQISDVFTNIKLGGNHISKYVLSADGGCSDRAQNPSVPPIGAGPPQGDAGKLVIASWALDIDTEAVLKWLIPEPDCGDWPRTLEEAAQALNRALHALHAAMVLHGAYANAIEFDWVEKAAIKNHSLIDYCVMVCNRSNTSNVNNINNTLPVRRFRLRACNGKYVCAENAMRDSLIANRATAAQWETFIQIGPDTDFLWQTSNCQLVTSEPFNRPAALPPPAQGEATAWADVYRSDLQSRRFTMEHLGDNKVAIRSCSTGKYVCADEAGSKPLVINRDHVGEWETFILIQYEPLTCGQTLKPGQFILSQNGLFKLIYQTDGNLVLYGWGGVPLWNTETNGLVPGRVDMQSSDGHFVVYDASGKALWCSGVYGPQYINSQLRITDDGLLFTADSSGKVTWNHLEGKKPSGSVSQADAAFGSLVQGSYQIFSASAYPQQLIVDHNGAAGGAVGVYGGGGWRSGNDQATWLLEPCPPSSFYYGNTYAPKGPWVDCGFYKIRNKQSGQSLIVFNDGNLDAPVGMIGDKNGDWGQPTYNTQPLWRLWRLRSSNIYTIQHHNGQLLIVGNGGAPSGPVQVIGHQGTWGEEVCNPQKLWMISPICE